MGIFKARPELEDVSDPTGWAARVLEYLTSCEERSLAAETIEQRRNALSRFVVWCKERGVAHPKDATQPLLERYRQSLAMHHTDDGRPWSVAHQFALMQAVRGFFVWLHRQGYVATNPAVAVELPRFWMNHPRKRADDGFSDLADPTGFARRALEFLDWCETKGHSVSTVKGRRKALRVFLRWCREVGIAHPRDVTREHLARYQRWAFTHRTDDGKPWSMTYQFALLDVVRLLFSWMVKQNLVLINPASELELPRIQKSLPKQVLTRDEVERIMLQPDLTTPRGLRDRAILETLYSTAIRRAELTRLSLYDVNMEWGTVTVRLGKGGKDRVVPIGERALTWMRRYLCDARPYLVSGADNGLLFLSTRGKPLSVEVLTSDVHDYVKAAGVKKPGSCHLFRHTAATLMLENGADLRFIQALLGHASITTTTIYTAVSIRKLKEVHTATHPAATAPPVTADRKFSDEHHSLAAAFDVDVDGGDE